MDLCDGQSLDRTEIASLIELLIVLPDCFIKIKRPVFEFGTDFDIVFEQENNIEKSCDIQDLRKYATEAIVME